MALRVDVLDVQQDQIRHFHQFIQLVVIARLARAVGNAGGIQAGVDVLLPGQGKQLQHKIDLHQGLAAGDGDAALAVKSRVALVFPDQGLGRADRAGVHLPGIRVVAVLAAHGTALQEYHKPHAGSIHSAEALSGMDKSVHSNQICSWKVREITSSCCSLVSFTKFTA